MTLMEEAELNIRTFTKEELKDIAKNIAIEHNVSYEVMDTVVECESRWNPDAIGDNGNSYGLVQIFMPIWKDEITIEQATEPYFSLHFLGDKLSKGEGRLWTCYRKLQGLSAK